SAAMAQNAEEPRQQDDCSGGEDKGGWNVAQVLSHADAHGGAAPSRNGIEPTGLPAALRRGSSRRQHSGIGYQGDRIQRDADGIEDRSRRGEARIEQKQAGKAQRQERGRENRPQTLLAE